MSEQRTFREKMALLLKVVRWIEPNLVWIAGLVAVLSAMFRPGILHAISKSPQPLLILYGLLLFFAGRETNRARKKLKRERQSKEIYKRQLEELEDDWVELLDETRDYRRKQGPQRSFLDE